MKKLIFFNFLVIGFLSLTFFSTVKAQEEMPRSDAPPKEFNNPPPRPNLLRELGLSREQTQQIRQFNQSRKSLMMEAQSRVRDATKNLDQAIYADSLNEGEIASRLKELQNAQAEIAKLRSFNELEVRKLLTPAQLAKFREIRQQFAEMREKNGGRRANSSGAANPNAPNRRFNRQLRKIPRD